MAPSSSKLWTTESGGSLRPLIHNCFKNKNDVDAVPKNKKEKEMGNLIEFIAEKCVNVDSPLSICRLIKGFNKKFGLSRPRCSFHNRIRAYCREIQTLEFLGTPSKVKQLFGLSATLDMDFLKELRKDAVVEVDDLNRITKYTANDGILTLHGDHSLLEKRRTALLALKRSHRSYIIDYFNNKNDADAIPKNREKKEMWNLIDFITEKCKNVYSPLSIRQLTKDFNKHFGTSRATETIARKIKTYSREIQKAELLDTHSTVKQLFVLSVKLDPDCLLKLRKTAVVEVDDKYRIIKYTANDGSLTLRGSHYGSGMTRRSETKKGNNIVEKADESEDGSDNEVFNDSSDGYSSEEFDSEFDSDEENDHLDKTEDHMDPSTFKNKTPVRNRSSNETSIDDDIDFDPPSERFHTSEDIAMRKDEGKENDFEITENAGIKTRSLILSKKGYSDSEDDNENDDLEKPENAMEPSNEANDSDNDTPVGNRSPNNTSFDDNFDFDPPIERSHESEETEMRENEGNDSGITGNTAVKTKSFPIETLPKSKTSFSISHTPKTSKRKAVPSGSSSSKRTKSPLEKSMNPIEMDDNISYDDPSRVDLEPLLEPLGHPEGIEEDPDIQHIPKPRPQVIEAPIKKEYEEEAQTSLKMVLNAFKSLVRSLDTTGLSQLQMEIDKRVMETGRRIEVSNKELILAMKFLVLKLSKHGALESSEDSISLRDILLMLRTIILNSSFNGLEVILEMLKENIEQLKILDKKVPVSQVECVLRATLDNVCT